MSNVCLACLKNSPTLYNLWDVVVNQEGKAIPIHEMLSYCCSVKFIMDTPRLICSSCADICVTAYNFIKQFRANNKSLFDLLNSKENNAEGIKIDITSDDVKDIEMSASLSATSDFKSGNEMDLETDIKDENLKLINVNTAVNEQSTSAKVVEKVKRHICPLCQKTFIQYDNWNMHIRQKHANENVSCHLCNKEFNVMQEFLTHYLKYHFTDGQVWVEKIKAIKRKKPALINHFCPICNESIPFMSRLIKHLTEIHKNILVFNCKTCKEPFSNPEDYFRHYEVKHVKYCKICDASFALKSAFIVHKRRHANRMCYAKPKPHICPFCDFKQDRFDLFRNHIGKAHNRRLEEISCQICDEQVKNGRDFVKHYIKNHRIRCQNCRVHFTSQDAYNAHLNNDKVSENPVQDNMKISNEKRKGNQENQSRKGKSLREKRQLICPICRKNFTNIHYYTAHFSAHADECDAPMSCVNCDLTCANAEEFLNHYKSAHFILCKACRKYYPDRNSFESHDCNRKGSRPGGQTAKGLENLCPVCGVNYKGSLKYHLESHDTTPNYKCNDCDKTFTVYHHFRYHRKKNHVELKYLCPHCGKLFVQKSALTTHLQYHTGKKLYSCLNCGQGFTTTNARKKHVVKNLCGKRKISTETKNIVNLWKDDS